MSGNWNWEVRLALCYYYYYMLWKESLNSDGQQCHQYQQTKRKFKQW
jgi:hypothetical protein